MDNLPKEQNLQEAQTGGEIFSDQPVTEGQSGETTGGVFPSNESGQEIPINLSAESAIPAEETAVPEGSSGNGGSASAPPFYQDNRKKYLIFFFFFFVILIGIIFIFNPFFKKKPKTNIALKLTYWGLWEDKDLLQPVIDDYKRTHPNVDIIYVKQDQKQYRERLQAAIDRGEGPDIFRFHNTWLPMLIKDLSPMPANLYASGEFEKTFFPVAVEDLKVGSSYYGLPLMIDGLMLFYNEDILKSANVSIPSTWVDVQNALTKLTVKEKERIITSAIALGGAENIEHFSDILGLMMLQNGVQLKKSFFSCNNSASNSCAVDALSFYHRFAEVPNNTWNDTLENSIVAFAEGKVAMIFAPSWQIFTIKALNPNLNFKTAKLPQLPCDKEPCPAINWATYWIEGVSNKSKNQPAAWDFLNYLSQEQTMKRMYELQAQSRKLFGEPYSRIELLKTLSDNPLLSPLVEMAPTMKSFYLASRTFDGETGINTALIKYLKDAVNSLSQGGSPESALKTADEGLKQIFSRYGINPAP